MQVRTNKMSQAEDSRSEFICIRVGFSAPGTLLSDSIGNHLSCCSFVPYLRNMVLTRVLWTSQRTETDGSTLASSSMAMMAAVKEDSAPPCSALVSIPMSFVFISKAT